MADEKIANHNEAGGGCKVSSLQKPSNYLNRVGLNEEQLESRYNYKSFKSDNVFHSSKKYLIKYYKPSRRCMSSYLLDRVPFFKWIFKYDIKENLFKDFIGGVTIGIIQIPQGMAYSLMAGMPPILGLYVSFFTVITYALLGTSRHLSLVELSGFSLTLFVLLFIAGIYAIISLMTKSAVDRFEGIYFPTVDEANSLNGTLALNSTLHTINAHYLSNDPVEARIMIGMVLAFYTGILQILFAIFHVGFVTKFLSDVIVAAFTTGAAYHIVTSQLNSLLGLKIGNVEIIFQIIGNLILIFEKIAQANVATIVISLVTMTFLYCVKHFVNQKYGHRMIAPVPVDLIVIICGTALSYSFNFQGRWKVAVVGNIPLGMPSPKLPTVGLFTAVFSDALSIAIVSFAINISMAKMFSKKYNYGLDTNQELFAYGVGNLVSSFFSGFPSCVGLSRSVILDSVGAKTQLYSVFSCVLILIVILFIGPLFEALPIACLAAIIVVALITLIIEVKQIYCILKRSKLEALAWITTFLGVVILDVDYGLYLGLCFSLLLIIVQSQRASTSVLGNIPYTDIYESIDVCEEAKEFDGIKIIRYESSIYYANVDNFTYKILKNSCINVDHIMEKIKKRRKEYEHTIQRHKTQLKKMLKKSQKTGSGNVAILPDFVNLETYEADLKTELDRSIDEIRAHVCIKHIILDFSSTNIIDSMGVAGLIQLNDTFKECGATMHLTYCKPLIEKTLYGESKLNNNKKGSVFRALKKNMFKEKFDYDHIYPTTHDAISTILNRLPVAANHQTLEKEASEHKTPTFNINVIEEQTEQAPPQPNRKLSSVVDEKDTFSHELIPYRLKRHSSVFNEMVLHNIDIPRTESGFLKFNIKELK